ncbi:MAG: preprotein translocase subunit SecG [Lachnospiraceae bacterium]|nr:preprotein translocase subunit SecG [Lachnospiraceae bacterium]
MGALRMVLMILIIIVSIAMTVLILMQEGKSQGLGAISGSSSSDTYWGKNKGRSKEGLLVKVTTGLVVAFFVIAILLNMHLF